MPVNNLLDGRLSALAGKKVLVIGDVMLDTYLTGDAERLSPEAPVPVVRVTAEQRLLGGAGNVAANIAALGGAATLIGITGEDSAARHIEDLARDRGIEPAMVTLPERATTVKTRVMALRQQMLRLDHETKGPLDDPQRSRLVDKIREAAPGHDIIVLSDYAKGLIDPAVTSMLREWLETLPNRPYLLVDPKPGNMSLFAGADLLTPNSKETSESVHMPMETPEQIVSAGKEVLRRFRCRHLLSTLGPQGMALFCSPDEVWHIPTVARDVFDVTGAGDTVIATLALALAAGLSLLDACILANHAAGIVVGKIGAATVTVHELADFIGSSPNMTPSRWA